MIDLDKQWRDIVAECCGGVTFDAQGGGYSFSNVLAEERELAKGNVEGDSSSALCCLSIADPRWKMPEGLLRNLSGITMLQSEFNPL